jgi:hypothetical protein
MFLADSASMVCAVCVADFLDGSWMLFENSGPQVEKRDTHARPQNLRVVNRNF